MMKILNWFYGLFFTRISASGFGLMRIMWGSVVLFFLLVKWNDVHWIWSDAGIVPVDDLHILTRTTNRFSILDTITKPEAVFSLYLFFVFCLVCTIVGQWPRLMTTISVLLLFSFHERNSLVLNGGDTVLRCVGFLLLVSPELRAFSLKRLGEQWANWKAKGKLLPQLKMYSWPYRLVLWQLMLIYITSSWGKSYGNMWWDGTAVGAAIHHAHFARYSKPIMDMLSVHSTVGSHYTLFYQFAWVFMLIPRGFIEQISFFKRHSLKRILLFGGVLFHGGIFITMNVGPFCWSMFTLYMGALLHEDFVVLRKWKNRRIKGTVAVLFDGHCGLCQRSVFFLKVSDPLKRLTLADAHSAANRKKYAPGKKKADLLHEMHIRLPDGSYQSGFYAFRALCRHIPILWPIKPFLHLPFAAFVGTRVYAKVAANRLTCIDGACKL